MFSQDFRKLYLKSSVIVESFFPLTHRRSIPNPFHFIYDCQLFNEFTSVYPSVTTITMPARYTVVLSPMIQCLYCPPNLLDKVLNGIFKPSFLYYHYSNTYNKRELNSNEYLCSHKIFLQELEIYKG